MLTNSSESTGPSRWARRVIAVAAGLFILALLAQFAAARLVDSELIRERVQAATAGGGVDIRIGDARFDLLRRRIDLEDVTLEGPGGLRMEAERVDVRDLPLRSMAGDGPAWLGKVHLERPVLHVPPRSIPDSTVPVAAASTDSFELHVERLVVREGTLIGLREAAADPAPGFPRFELAGIDVVASDLVLGSRGLVEHPSSVEVRTGSMERLSADSIMKLSFASLHYDGDARTMVIESPRYEPTLDDSDFFAALDRRKTRLRISAARVEAREYDLLERIRGNLVARAFQFDSVRVDVFANKRLPSAGREPWLPNELIRNFGGRLAVDSVLADVHIDYTELPMEEVREPGRISFEDMRVVSTGVSNDDPSMPLVVATTMRLFGAPAETRMAIPLDEGAFRMKFTGSVGPVDLRRLSSITVPLQGIEIQDGRMEGMRFDIDVEERHAGGSVWLVYDDLDVQIVDRESGEGGLFDDIKSFVANTFVLDGDNLVEDGAAPEPGRVALYFPPRTAFFSRVWIPVREGMMSIAKD